MALLIRSNGEVTEIQPANGDTFTLPELQTYVGDYIEQIQASNGDLLIVNEYGTTNALPVNEVATARYGDLEDEVRGDVVVCTLQQLQGG